jgi:hypothetical protein
VLDSQEGEVRRLDAWYSANSNWSITVLPVYPGRQLPHVPAVFKQYPLCRTVQSGALLQSTVFIVVATYRFGMVDESPSIRQ